MVSGPTTRASKYSRTLWMIFRSGDGVRLSASLYTLGLSDISLQIQGGHSSHGYRRFVRIPLSKPERQSCRRVLGLDNLCNSPFIRLQVESVRLYHTEPRKSPENVFYSISGLVLISRYFIRHETHGRCEHGRIITTLMPPHCVDPNRSSSTFTSSMGSWKKHPLSSPPMPDTSPLIASVGSLVH